MLFFRSCPNCRRRFYVKLVSKEHLHTERESGWTARYGPHGGFEGRPMVLEVDEVQYNYKCKSCGHEWSEKRTEQHKEG